MCLVILSICFFFFKQKTAYEMRISDWSSDVCSSDLLRSMKEKDWPEPMALCLARNVVEVDLGGKVETTLVLSLTDQPRPDEQWFRERVSDLRRDGTPIRTIAEILGATKSKVEH